MSSQRKSKAGTVSNIDFTSHPGTADKAPTPARKDLEPRFVNPDFIKSGVAYPIKVLLASGDSVEVHATSNFTIRELIELIVAKLDMWQYEVWSLCLFTTDATKPQIVMKEKDKYVKQSVQWLDPAQTLDECRLVGGSTVAFLIKYYKVYFKLIDPVAVRLYYSQVRNEFLSGVHPSGSSKTAVRLAALQMQAETGDFNRGTTRKGFFTAAKLATVLPEAVISRNSEDYLLQRIFFYHRRLSKTPKIGAQLAYIAESRNISNWGATWFDGKLNAYKNLRPQNISVGVCEDGFVLPIAENDSKKTEDKLRTVSRRKLIDAAKTHSIMNLNSVLDTAELGMLHQKASDDNYVFFPFHLTYIEETRTGLALKKKGEAVDIGLTPDQVDAILTLTDSYVNILTHSGWQDLPMDELPPASSDLPDFKLFELPMDRSIAKKEVKRGKTMLELWKDNYIEASSVAQRPTIARVLLQIEAKIDESVVLEEIDLMRCGLTDTDYSTIEQSIAATYHMFQLSEDKTAGVDMAPHTLLLSHNDLVNPSTLGDTICALKLTTVDLRSNSLSPAWADVFGKALPRCVSLMTLDVGDNPLTNDGVISLTNGLVTLLSIRNIGFANTGITNALSRWSSVKTLHGSDKATLRGATSGNGPDVGRVIASLLVTCKKLERLDLSDNVITASGIDYIVDALEKTDALQERLFELNLGNTHISGDVGSRLVRWLTKTFNDSRNHLTTLDLHANQFEHEALTLIGDLFMPSATFRVASADISRLGFKWEPIATILGGLSGNSRLRSLNLSYNTIPAKLAKALGTMVTQNTTLQTLRLRNCSMEKAAVVALGDALAKNLSLTELDCAGNNFEAHSCGTAWETALKKNKTLTQLNLACCNLDGDSLEHIGDALKTNEVLQLLHLDANYIGQRGLKKLGHGLKLNRTLRVLSLQDIDCKYKDTCNFIREISPGCALQSIDLRFNPDLTNNVTFDEIVQETPNILIRYTPKPKGT